MNEFIHGMAVFIGFGAAISFFFFRKGGIYNPKEPVTSTDNIIAVITPEPEPVPPPPTLLWDTQKHSYHSTRVLCDEMGLSLEEKNLICACIYQESQFKNSAVGRNSNTTDWGIVQVNDYYHIGAGKDFPSVEYVVNNPEKMVRWMIRCYKQGQLKMWASYSTGVYKHWLIPTSPMWLLKS